MRKVAFSTAKATIALIGISASAIAVGQAYDSDLPYYELSAHCDSGYWFNSYEDLQDQQLEEAGRVITDFIDFAKAHDGEVVYVEYDIEASNGAGSCQMYEEDELYKRRGENDERSSPFIVDRPADYPSFPGTTYFAFSATTPIYSSGTSSVMTPKESSIPPDGLYVVGRHHYYYYVHGPFRVNHHYQNGWQGASLTPISFSYDYRKEIRCTKRRMDPENFIYKVLPCL